MSVRHVASSTRRLPSGTFWTVLRKDMRLLFRDALIWYNLVIGVIVVGFIIYNRLSQPGRPAGDDALVTGIAVLMGVTAGAQTGGISISREGSGFWLLRGNPVDARGLFAAKTVYALLPPTIMFALSVTAVSVLGLRQQSLSLTVLLGMSAVVAVASAQILFDVFFPDFALKVEFGSSSGGHGTGKLNVVMVGSMVMVFALFFIMAFSTTPLPGRWFPGVSIETVTLATRIIVVGIGFVAAAAAAVFGVRRTRRILTDM